MLGFSVAFLLEGSVVGGSHSVPDQLETVEQIRLKSETLRFFVHRV